MDTTLMIEESVIRFDESCYTVMELGEHEYTGPHTRPKPQKNLTLKSQMEGNRPAFFSRFGESGVPGVVSAYRGCSYHQ
jgi:hypothetical protein